MELQPEDSRKGSCPAEEWPLAKESVIPVSKPDRSVHRNWLIAFLMLMLYITFLVSSSQLTSSAFNEERYKPYKAPFLFIWCKLFLRSFTFLIVLSVLWIVRKCKGRPFSVHKIWLHCTSPLRTEDQPTLIKSVTLLHKFWPIVIVTISLQVAWIVGHVYAPSSLMTALGSGTVAISYVLSWLVLKNRMLVIKGCFVLVAFAGIGMICYGSLKPEFAASAFQSTNTSFDNSTADPGLLSSLSIAAISFEGASIYIGVICGLSGALFMSLHTLAFKKAFQNVDLMQVALIVSVTHFFACIVFFPVAITFNLTDYEPWHLTRMPWAAMLTAWTCALISALSYAYGLALSNPFFMSLAEVIVVAISTALDAFMRGMAMNNLQICGIAIVAVAFVMMVMPDPWLDFKDEEASGEEVPGRKSRTTDL
ncbi:hypothetical protein RvY_14922 [Ramazzottius varieornatus]|uniref:EamA domain-containing protein n=1 Tax=Ramazzottius varieornatus TaxID=947166 RepID=A0A1D1VSY2_RAMVA|nr:hypothetical protein RvY_14922 [Ramazzottius varieornatus]